MANARFSSPEEALSYLEDNGTDHKRKVTLPNQHKVVLKGRPDDDSELAIVQLAADQRLLNLDTNGAPAKLTVKKPVEVRCSSVMRPTYNTTGEKLAITLGSLSGEDEAQELAESIRYAVDADYRSAVLKAQEDKAEADALEERSKAEPATVNNGQPVVN